MFATTLRISLRGGKRCIDISAIGAKNGQGFGAKMEQQNGMTGTVMIFGLGYTGQYLAHRLRADGWRVCSTKRAGGGGAIAFEDGHAVQAAVRAATHVVVSTPPDGDADPVLARYGAVLDSFSGWTGYLSSTGVYGDTGGAWVDETAATGMGRRTARALADAAWLARGARVFRLPGIYGPGRSALERLQEGRAVRVDAPGQVFSRIHVDDIVRGVIAGFGGPPGAYNLADDAPCGQNAVIDYAAALLGVAPPPMVRLEDAGLSAMARGFYAENRRVANGKAQRLLGWRPVYADFRAGLRAVMASINPPSASTAPIIATGPQR